MSAQHTPGPWSINPTGRTPVIGLDLHDGGSHLPLVTQVHGYDKAQANANVRLIAAAPDLLDALIACISGEFATTDKAALAKADAAIARATKGPS